MAGRKARNPHQPDQLSLDPLALPVPQAAEAIGVSVTTIRRLLKRGVRHEVRHGKRGFPVLYADLRSLVEARVGTYHPAKYNRDFAANRIRASAAKRRAG
jgi:hypothetical protein